MNKNTKIELNANDMKKFMLEAINGVVVEGDKNSTDELQSFLSNEVDTLLEKLDEEIVMQGIKDHLIEDFSNGILEFLQDDIRRKYNEL